MDEKVARKWSIRTNEHLGEKVTVEKESERGSEGARCKPCDSISSGHWHDEEPWRSSLHFCSELRRRGPRVCHNGSCPVSCGKRPAGSWMQNYKHQTRKTFKGGTWWGGWGGWCMSVWDWVGRDGSFHILCRFSASLGWSRRQKPSKPSSTRKVVRL